MNENLITQTKKQFYGSIDLFRGFAIWLIVTEHILSIFVQSNNVENYFQSRWLFIHRYLDVFAGGGSAYFVFISGFLFYTVFYQRGFTQLTCKNFSQFLIGKCKKVFSPYFIIVLVFIAFRLWQDPHQFSVHFLQYQGFWFASFWYVPFIMVIFLLTPLYVKFIQIPDKWRILIFIVSLILSLSIGRHELNPVLSALFWNSLYMFGIFVGMHYRTIINLDFGWKATICLVSFLSATLLCSIPGGSYMHSGGGIWNIDFNYVHVQIVMKMALCVVYLYLFEILVRMKNLFVAILKVLAKYSFTIFFLHQFAILFFVQHKLRWIYDNLNFWTTHISVILVSALICILCICVAVPIKKITGKYSRCIIGA